MKVNDENSSKEPNIGSYFKWLIIGNIALLILQIWVIYTKGNYVFFQPEGFWLDTSYKAKFLMLNLFALPATYIQMKILRVTADFKDEEDPVNTEKK